MSAALAGSLTDWVWNAFGTQSPDQKQALIDQCVASQIQAGADQATAQATCQQTITTSLVGNNSDPSQEGVGTMLMAPLDSLIGQPVTANPFQSPSSIAELLLLAGVAVVGIVLVTSLLSRR